jgi:lysozyme
MQPTPILFAAAACLALYYMSQQEGSGIVDTVDSALSSFESNLMSIDNTTAADPQVAAFLALIRFGESSNSNNAYTMLYGGGQFADLSEHPKRFFTVADGRRTSAAGAYQITLTTWNWLRTVYTISDFTPASQDFAAVALIKRRGALADVLAGRFDRAIAKCRNEWTSLPGAMEGRYSLAKAHEILLAHGAQFEGSNIA